MLEYQEDIFITVRCSYKEMNEVLRGIKQEILIDYRNHSRKPHVELVSIKRSGFNEYLAHWSVQLNTEMNVLPKFCSSKYAF